MATTPPDIVEQSGPYIGDAKMIDKIVARLGRRLVRRGYPWWRSTQEGRMILMEGWRGPQAPNQVPFAPELQGKLPEGWRVGR